LLLSAKENIARIQKMKTSAKKLLDKAEKEAAKEAEKAAKAAEKAANETTSTEPVVESAIEF
jgi:vacuolar-type H+-ATPase subunit H